jgi:hypothetical protein
MGNFQEEIFKLDNRMSDLQFTFSDSTPVRPILRWQLRIAEMQSNATAQRKATRDKPVTLWKYMRFCWWKRPKIASRPDVLSIANNEGNQDVPNRMTVFLKELPELTKSEWLYSNHRRMFGSIKGTYSFDYFFYKAWLISKVLPNRQKKAWAPELDTYFADIRESQGLQIKPDKWEEIRLQLLFINSVLPAYRKTLKKSLRQLNPRLILVSEGNNGEWKQAVLFQIAKELGIPTAEVQHGVFNMGMKYGPKLAASPALKAMKSDYELVFGPYHTALTNAPVQCIPFGHYDLEQALKRLQNNPPEKKGKEVNITLIGEGIPPSSVENGLLRHTLSALQQWKQSFKLCIRLHPSELPDAKYEPFFQFHGTHYSELKDESIYEVINNTDILISHASTVVFEALYFQKNVCVLRDDNTAVYVPEGVGLPFRDTESLLELLNQLATGKEITKSNANDYWSTEGVSLNFRNFWKKQILK